MSTWNHALTHKITKTWFMVLFCTISAWTVPNTQKSVDSSSFSSEEFMTVVVPSSPCRGQAVTHWPLSPPWSGHQEYLPRHDPYDRNLLPELHRSPKATQNQQFYQPNNSSSATCKLISCPSSQFNVLHKRPKQKALECGPMPNVMVAPRNIGGALCLTPQSLADAHY